MAVSEEKTRERNRVIHSEARGHISKTPTVRSRRMTACADRPGSVFCGLYFRFVIPDKY
jgi:hypothetical protein